MERPTYDVKCISNLYQKSTLNLKRQKVEDCIFNALDIKTMSYVKEN